MSYLSRTAAPFTMIESFHNWSTLQSMESLAKMLEVGSSQESEADCCVCHKILRWSLDGCTHFISFLWVLFASLQNGRSGSPDCGCRNSEDEGDEDIPADSRRIMCRKCGNNHLWVSTEKTKPRARWCQVKFMWPSCILLMLVNQLHELVCKLWFGTMPTSVTSLCDLW